MRTESEEATRKSETKGQEEAWGSHLLPRQTTPSLH